MKNAETIRESNLVFPYQLEALPFATHSLEPYIDKATMEIHHGKHHAAYVDNLNKALEGHDKKSIPLIHLFDQMSSLPAAVRNNGGGHFNHSFFWQLLKVSEKGMPSGELLNQIQSTFGGFDAFREEFAKAAMTRFGSGWAWLSVDENKQLFISSTPNQDNPLMDVADRRGIPIIGLDVWEHAYYLHYQNRRVDYVNSFWNIVNWAAVEHRFNEAIR